MGEHKSAKIRSQYVGVNWSGWSWQAKICFNKRHIVLGYFTNEHDAHLAYQKALQQINDGLDLNVLYPLKKIKKSKYRGVYKERNKWGARIVVHGKKIHLGYFILEIDASIVYENYKLRLNVR